MIIGFFLTYSLGFPATVLAVFLSAPDDANPFKEYGTKGMLLRCCGFELAALICAVFGLIVLLGGVLGGGIGGLLGLLIGAAIGLGGMVAAAMALFDREVLGGIVLVLSVWAVNLLINWGIGTLVG
jgi:hypothetical protein